MLRRIHWFSAFGPKYGFSLKVVFLLTKLYFNVVIIQSFNRFILNTYYMLGTLPSVGSINMKEATSHIAVFKVIHLRVDWSTAQNSVDSLLSICSSFLLLNRSLLLFSYSWAPEQAGPIPGLRTGHGVSKGIPLAFPVSDPVSTWLSQSARVIQKRTHELKEINEIKRESLLSLSDHWM